MKKSSKFIAGNWLKIYHIVMRKGYINLLVSFQKRKTTQTYKIISLSFGIIFFLVVFPALFIYVGFYIDKFIHVAGNDAIRIVIALLTIVIGLSILSWSAYTLWKIGKGTPVPNAPTQQLIISGPYQHIRNPIELGGIIYYFGLGTIMGSYTIGVVAFLSGLIIGSTYHKLVEEKELYARFGDNYLNYKKEVPFLIPNFKR
ncbi:methyltransferase family protein [Massilibacteroides vaginae]|uniref:methyltransferase family protein n=1 Tax=Massilibacteroides vaginae TaxID=1673718 RepID=UPI000A1CC733|nr:isoprenylcysteine carboxylmethyltransferase family protein [Massilibacteroides vaginae]